MLSYGLYAEDSKWEELAKYTLQGDALLPFFGSLAELLATELGLVRPKPADPSVVELDEDDLQMPAPPSPEPLGPFCIAKPVSCLYQNLLV